MSDRELLELAARAAGLTIDKSPYNGGGHGNTGFDTSGNAMLDWHNGKMWNPLTDDGDALRLAVKLRIVPDVWGEVALASLYEEDECKRVRRAIVIAAAAIGKEPPHG